MMMMTNVAFLLLFDVMLAYSDDEDEAHEEEMEADMLLLLPSSRLIEIRLFC